MTADLIVFGEDWGRHPSSTQHLVRHLAEDRNVIWVNSIGMRRPRLSAKDISRAVCKVGKAFSKRPPGPEIEKPETMTIVDPFAAPFPGNPAAATFNRAVVGKKVRAEMARRGMEEPILWTSLPTAVDLLGAFGERGTVYYCGDDFGALAGVDHAPVLKCEARLARKAEVILAASERLVERFEPAKTKYLPHGLDVDLFSAPAERAPDLPKHGNVAGFYGSLSDWLDQELIAHCARTLPDWTFVFVGDERTDLSTLRALENVKLLGPRPHRDLPKYAQHWTVSLMPFKDNDQIRACNPLKLREYLAAGRPVVSTEFPAARQYDDFISIAGTPDAFLSGINCAPTESRDQQTRRRASVQEESWQSRARFAANILDTL